MLIRESSWRATLILVTTLLITLPPLAFGGDTVSVEILMTKDIQPSPSKDWPRASSARYPTTWM